RTPLRALDSESSASASSATSARKTFSSIRDWRVKSAIALAIFKTAVLKSFHPEDRLQEQSRDVRRSLGPGSHPRGLGMDRRGFECDVLAGVGYPEAPSGD